MKLGKFSLPYLFDLHVGTFKIAKLRLNTFITSYVVVVLS